MRHKRVRLGIILLYAASAFALPVPLSTNGLAILLYFCDEAYAAPAASGCPMCRAAADAHRECECCRDGACTCNISSDEEYIRVILLLDSAILVEPESAETILPVLLPPSGAPPSIPIPVMPVLTPPPKL